MSRYSPGIDPNPDCLLDPQQQEPAGWCPECGGEIWEQGKNLCPRCQGRNGTEPLVKTREISFIVDASAPMHRAVREFLNRHNLKFREEVVSNV